MVRPLKKTLFLCVSSLRGCMWLHLLECFQTIFFYCKTLPFTSRTFTIKTLFSSLRPELFMAPLGFIQFYYWVHIFGQRALSWKPEKNKQIPGIACFSGRSFFVDISHGTSSQDKGRCRLKKVSGLRKFPLGDGGERSHFQ